MMKLYEYEAYPRPRRVRMFLADKGLNIPCVQVNVPAGRQTETGLFLQGLIQVAVAHLKNFQGFTDVAKRIAIDGLDKMKFIKGVYLGINVAVFRNAVE